MDQIKTKVLEKTKIIDLYLLEMIQKAEKMNYISLNYVMDIYKSIEKYILYLNDTYMNHLEFNPTDEDITPSVLMGALFYLLYSKSTLFKDFEKSIDEKLYTLKSLESEIQSMIENKEYYYSFYYINRLKIEKMFQEIDFFYKICVGNLCNFENIIAPSFDKVCMLHKTSYDMCILVEKIKP
jgi:hypothetical protein